LFACGAAHAQSRSFDRLGSSAFCDRTQPLAMRLQVSLPSTIETFARERQPHSERVELCHDGHRVVVHRGWTPIADGCKPGQGDRVISLD